MKGKGGTRNASSRSSRTLRFQSELYDFCSKDYEDLITTWKEIRKWITSHSNERLTESAQFKGSGGAVALHMLSKNCAPLDIMEIVIDANREALKLVDNFGWLPLHYACHHGVNEDVLRLMVTSYPDATKKEDNKGRIPLHFAVGGTLKRNSFTIPMFELLCEGGAASHPDEKGMLPLHFACAYGAPNDILSVLTDFSDDSIMSKDVNGLTAFHYAMGNCDRAESPNAIEFLFSKDPEIANMDCELKRHPLYMLAKRAKNLDENVEKEQRATATKCLNRYLDMKPKGTTNLFTSLQSLPKYLQDQAVVNPVVQELLNESMSKKRFPTMILMLDFYALLAILVTYSFAVIDSIDRRSDDAKDNTVSMSLLVPLYLSGAYIFVREVAQALSFMHLGLFHTWIIRPSNWIDLLLIALVLFWTIIMDTGALHIDVFRTGASVTVFYLWLSFLNFLRGLMMDCAVFFSGVLHVVQGLGAFLMATLIILIAFMQMFFAIFQQTEYCDGFHHNRTHVETCDPEGGDDSYRFCTLWDSLLSVYTMLLGEVDEGDFATSKVATFLFIIFVFLVVILLANVLIAIVTDSYGVIRNQRAAIIFWTNRLDFVVEMDVISNGPWKSKVSSLVYGMDTRDDDHSPDKSSMLWKQLMFLFDKDFHRTKAWTIGYVCQTFLRGIVILVIIPVWIFLGCCTAGWLWPPQIRKRLLEERITKQRGAVVKTEIRKNEIMTLKNEIIKVTSKLGEKEGELNELKAGIILFQKEVSAEVEVITSIVKKLKESVGSRESDSSRSRSRSFTTPTPIIERHEDKP